MKTINKFLYAMMALSVLALAGCSDEKEYEGPGVPDVEGCYGVYFPSQENTSSTLVMNPNDPTYLTITAARTNSSGAITVPVSVTYSDESVLSVTELTFADGQSESSLTLNFPDAKEGTTYEANLTIEDPQYASRYNDNATSCDVSFMRVAYQNYLDPATGEPALVTFTQTWWGEVHTGYVRYYEVDGIRHCVTYDEAGDISGAADPGPGFWGSGEDIHLEFTWNATTNYIDIPVQKVFYNTSYSADVNIYDTYAYYNVLNSNYAGSWATADDFYSKNEGQLAYRSYYDGNGGFYFYVMYYYMPGVGGWSQQKFDVTGVASGFVRVDYSTELTAGQSSEGVLPVKFSVGADVSKVKYSVLAGSLTPIQVTNAVAAIADGSEANMKEATVPADTTVFTEGISLDSTGVYTLVAVPYDKTGSAQSDFAANVGFKYLKAGDEEANAVILSAALCATNKYASSGYTSENALEFWLSGADLESVRLGVYSQAEVEADAEACIEDVKKSDPIKDSYLEEVNGTGWTSVMSGLTPGTQYHLIVVASNGYATDTFAATATTTGDPLPIYATYTADDIIESALDPTGASYIGEWNLYEVDLRGSSSLRSYVGKATIAELDATKYGERTELYGQALTISGLSGGDASVVTKNGYDDAIVLDNYQGLMYVAESTTADGKMSIYEGALAAGQWGYEAPYSPAFIPVLDGYYALVDVSSYAESYDFSGIGWVANNAWYARMYDILLVDPEKDDNGMADKAASAISSASKLVAMSHNSVESFDGRVQSIIEILSRIPKVHNRFNIAPVEIQDDGTVRSVGFSSKRVATAARSAKVMVMEAPRSL